LGERIWTLSEPLRGRQVRARSSTNLPGRLGNAPRSQNEDRVANGTLGLPSQYLEITGWDRFFNGCRPKAKSAGAQEWNLVGISPRRRNRQGVLVKARWFGRFQEPTRPLRSHLSTLRDYEVQLLAQRSFIRPDLIRRETEATPSRGPLPTAAKCSPSVHRETQRPRPRPDGQNRTQPLSRTMAIEPSLLAIAASIPLPR